MPWTCIGGDTSSRSQENRRAIVFIFYCVRYYDHDFDRPRCRIWDVQNLELGAPPVAEIQDALWATFSNRDDTKVARPSLPHRPFIARWGKYRICCATRRYAVDMHRR